ncbi:MAG: DUF2299 family protein [Nitrososphaerales archaeon]
MEGTPQEISKKIQDWFVEDRFSIAKGDVANTDFSWKVISANIPVHVAKFNNRNDSVLVFGAISFVGEDKSRLLSHPRINDIFYELKAKYLETGLDYAFKPNLQDLNLIEIYQGVHYDGLTKHILMRTFVHVRNMLLWTAEKLSHEVGTTTKSQDVSSAYK